MATKRKHHEVTLKVKYETLKELEKGRPNQSVENQFSISGSTLASWKKKREKVFEAFQNYHWNDRVKTGTWSLAGNNIPINALFLLEKAHEFAKAFNYNDFTASNYGCSIGCSSLTCAILYIVKTSPAYFFQNLVEIIWIPITRKLM